MRRSIAITALSVVACGGFDGEGQRPEGVRVISGKLAPLDPTVLGPRQVALQLAAARLDAREPAPLVELLSGTPFNPAGEGTAPASFRLALPTDRTYVLIFQVPVGDGSGPGQIAGRVRFSASPGGPLTDLLSGRTRDAPVLRDLDLGVVKITRPAASEGADGSSRIGDNVVILGEGESIHPLAGNDIDGDGVPDLEDPDDDDDLIPDEGDLDANGDDIPDQSQSLDALPDDDGNGVPDAMQPQPS